MINFISTTWADIYNPLLILGKYRYKIYYGGRGGAKTEHFARALLKLTQQYKINVLCCREIQNSIEDSVYKVLKLLIEEFSLTEFVITKDRIRNVYTGSEFIFKGLKKETADSIKSLKGINICWVEEAHSVTHRSWEILDPTIREAFSEIWVSFNPNLPNDPVMDRYVRVPDKETLAIKVNWNDNPFFPAVLRKVKDRDYKRDPAKARHIWEGEPEVKSEALVFNGYWKVEDFKTVSNTRFYHGVDWGFAKDPTCIIRCFIEKNFLYIDRAEKKVKCDLGNETNVLFSKIETSKEWPIIADSARPESISAMRKYGYKITGAKKGKGSIEDGIEFIKSFDGIIIHSSCQDVIEEFSKYSYKVDRITEEILPVLVDCDNHFIDALRYALEPLMRKQKDAEQTAPTVGLFF